MTVVVPYTPFRLHTKTMEWAQQRADTQLVKLSDADDTAYWHLLWCEWISPIRTGDLLVVEHDMLPADGVVDRMLSCRRPWCASPYVIGAGTVLTDGLGCTKFAARLKERHPDLMERVGEIDNDGLPAKNWRRLDTRISSTLRGLGYRPHVHARSEHLHDYRTRP